MKRSRIASALLESLEPRNLLSGVLTAAPIITAPTSNGISAAAVTSTPPPSTSPVATNGLLLHLTAGQSFTGVVAFYPSPVLDPPDVYSASINWGDGAVSKATLQYAVQNNVGGYEIIGTHTYNSAGNYHILSTVFEGPLNPASTLPTKIVARILSLAIVSPPNSTGGVTIHEPAGTPFTADVGSFNFPAPGTGLAATIDWGDGTTPSQGTLIPSGIIGIDVIHYDVAGTHTYASPGTYQIHILITRSGPGATPTPTTSPVYILLTIDSTAIVGATAVPVTSTVAAF